MSNLYTVYFGLTTNHIGIQQYLTNCDIFFRVYYAAGALGYRIVYDIESDIEFLSVLSLKFGQVEVVSIMKGLDG